MRDRLQSPRLIVRRIRYRARIPYAAVPFHARIDCDAVRTVSGLRSVADRATESPGDACAATGSVHENWTQGVRRKDPVSDTSFSCESAPQFGVICVRTLTFKVPAPPGSYAVPAPDLPGE